MTIPPIPSRPVPSVRRFDATRLAKRISQSQEITGQHRVGTVNTVNTDGTVDVDLAGTVIPDVPTVGGVTVGGSVQLLVWQGDLLALAYTGPRGVLGYATASSSQTGISTTTDLTNLSVTVTVAAGRRIRITGQARIIQRTSAGLGSGRIREGGTTLHLWANNTLGVNTQLLAHGNAVVTPSAGSHTYKLSLETTAGTIDTIVDANGNAFILVEDIGAA